MRLLLPPSEGKTSPETGPVFDPDRLSFPELNPVRLHLIETLVTTCDENPEAAAKALGLGPASLHELGHNTTLRRSPCGAAGDIYTGVLYSALGFPELSDAQRSRLGQRVWIASALFGLVGIEDPIPAYRLSGDTRLPGIGSLTNLWKRPIGNVLAQADSLLVDLRSGVYEKLGPVPDSLLTRTVVPRVLQKMPSGPPKLVTHFNKATKGRLVRALAELERDLSTPEDFADWVASTGPVVDLFPPADARSPWTMDIVVDHV